MERKIDAHYREQLFRHPTDAPTILAFASAR
jgi:hypothetical protein